MYDIIFIVVTGNYIYSISNKFHWEISTQLILLLVTSQLINWYFLVVWSCFLKIIGLYHPAMTWVLLCYDFSRNSAIRLVLRIEKYGMQLVGEEVFKIMIINTFQSNFLIIMIIWEYEFYFILLPDIKVLMLTLNLSS